MRALISYDTLHGNTEQIAHAVGEGLESGAEVVVKKMADMGPDDVRSADLLVAGCPVHAWNVSRAARSFLRSLGGERFDGKKAAAFDTKFQGFLAGSAAKKLARDLQKRGFHVIAPAESFFVTGMAGPLKEGELERARAFGATLARASDS
jgi:flavodoxin